jgi:hypothetical protein
VSSIHHGLKQLKPRGARAERGEAIELVVGGIEEPVGGLHRHRSLEKGGHRCASAFGHPSTEDHTW